VAQPAWLETDVVLKQFGATRRRAVAAYVDFVRADVGLPSVWAGLRGQVFLGSDEFVERMTAALKDDDAKLRDVPRVQRCPPPRAVAPPLRGAVDGQPVSGPGSRLGPAQRAERVAAMRAAYASGHHTLRAIADAFGVHEATVSRALRGAGAASAPPGNAPATNELGARPGVGRRQLAVALGPAAWPRPTTSTPSRR
jgi:hypothetical protein